MTTPLRQLAEAARALARESLVIGVVLGLSLGSFCLAAASRART